MLDGERRRDQHQQVGFTEYEAKAYLSLLNVHLNTARAPFVLT
jgi:sugar-specific transcriptional regulator TrmB